MAAVSRFSGAEPHEVRELVAAEAVDERIGLVSDRGCEGEARREHYCNDKGPWIDAKLARQFDGDRRNHDRDRIVRQELGQDQRKT